MHNNNSQIGSKESMHITIVGGGPGGMSMALSLVDAGFHNIDLYESVGSIKDVGVGINLQPTAVRELTELGLEDDLASTGIPTAEMRYYNKFGQYIHGGPRGVAAGYKWPQYSIHRGKLLSLLYEAVKERLGADRIHTGHHLVDCGQCNSKNGAWADLLKRNGDHEGEVVRIETDLLIGCDGVHSAVRKAVTKTDDAPKFNGITMFRGATRTKPFLTGRTMVIAGHLEHEMVIYPISKEAHDEGESLVNWVALRKTSKEDDDFKEDWNKEANKEDFVDYFSDFKLDFLDVPDLIRGAPVVYKYPMCDRDPLDTWVYGRITLLGDAAHPMWPIGGNGATQTIMDARVLANRLALEPTIDDALQAYENERREATAAIATANREASAQKFLEIVHDKAPSGFENLDDIITKDEIRKISSVYKKLTGNSADAVNTKPSLSVKSVL